MPKSVLSQLHRLNLTVNTVEINHIYNLIKFRVITHGGHREPKKFPLYLNLYELRMLIFASSVSTFFQNVFQYYVLNFTISVFQYTYLVKFTEHYLKLVGKHNTVNSVLRYSQAHMGKTTVLKMQKNQIYLFGLPIYKIDHQNWIFLVKYRKKDRIYLGIGRGRSGVSHYSLLPRFLEDNIDLRPAYLYNVTLYFIANEILFFRVNEVERLRSEEYKAEYNPPATYPASSKDAGKPLPPEKRSPLRITRLVTSSQLYAAGFLLLNETINTHCPECCSLVGKSHKNITTIRLEVNGKNLVGRYHTYCLENIKTRAQEDEPGHNRTLSLLL